MDANFALGNVFKVPYIIYIYIYNPKCILKKIS